jgi:membrane protease YdiL (CAAX protease family)
MPLLPGESSPNERVLQRRSPRTFFLLVFALSIPFWILGAMVPVQLLPGLPLSSLAFICPMLAAMILIYRETKAPSVPDFLMRFLDYRRIKGKRWYATTVLLMPAIMLLSYLLIRLSGIRLPPSSFPAPAALATIVPFFIAAAGEELGWSGYVTDALQWRWNALTSALILGIIWAIWHIVPLMETNRSPTWIICWFLGTVSFRVILVWLYQNTGKSVFATSFLHASSNVCWVLTATYFNPLINGMALAFVAIVITFYWGPRTFLRRHRRLPGPVTTD